VAPAVLRWCSTPFKELGFHYASEGGKSRSPRNDVVAPPDKEEILERYESETEEIMTQYDEGLHHRRGAPRRRSPHGGTGADRGGRAGDGAQTSTSSIRFS